LLLCKRVTRLQKCFAFLKLTRLKEVFEERFVKEKEKQT